MIELPTAQTSFAAIAATPLSALMAFTFGVATHWNGSAWSTVATPNVNAINALKGVAAIASTDVWAVGSSIKSPSDGISQYRTLIEHYNGGAWSVVPSPNAGAGSNELTGVAAHSASDVWAVGYALDVTGDIPVAKTLWMHWDGTRWSTVPSPSAGTGDNLLDSVIAPAGTSDVWASGVSANGTLVEHYTK